MTEHHDRDILSAGHLDEPARDAARRRRRRIIAATVAVAAVALGVVLAAHPWQSHHERSGAFAMFGSGPAAVPPATPAALPGTVLASCDMASVGQAGADDLPASWRKEATQAGPLWFARLGGSGSASTGRPASARLVLDVVNVVVTGIRPGAAVAVRTTPAGRPYLRFLYGPEDSLSPGTAYTMTSGESGVTFSMCPQDVGDAVGPFTDFNGGLLVDGARCVPVDVWPPRHDRPIRISLGACR